MIRIPYWPGRALSLGGRPNPLAVTVQLADRPSRVTRLASAPGWMILAVRYDTGARPHGWLPPIVPGLCSHAETIARACALPEGHEGAPDTCQMTRTIPTTEEPTRS